MSKWNHAICPKCWNVQRPDRQIDPTEHRYQNNMEPEPCCYCGENTTSGIYVREDPSKLRCFGEHTVREENRA